MVDLFMLLEQWIFTSGLKQLSLKIPPDVLSVLNFASIAQRHENVIRTHLIIMVSFIIAFLLWATISSRRP